MQFFGTLLYLHKENEINRISSQVFFELLVKLFFLMAIIYLCVHIVVPECFKMLFQDYIVVQDLSLKKFLSLKLIIDFSFLTQSIFGPYRFQNRNFYQMAISYIIVIASYINAAIYKRKTFIKKQYLMVQVKINWRKNLKPLIFLENTTDKSRLDFVQPYLIYFV